MAWVPYRTDLVLLGLLFGTVGSILLMKGVLWRPTLREEAATFLGSNPYIIKAGILQRWDYAVGGFWIFAGSVASFIGTVQAFRDPRPSERWAHLPSPYLGATFVILLFVFSILGVSSAKRFAMRQVVPLMAQMQEHLVVDSLGTIEHNGVPGHCLIPGAVQPSEAERAEYLEQARKRLAQVGGLVELRREPHESDLAYAKRLALFCRRYTARMAQVTHEAG